MTGALGKTALAGVSQVEGVEHWGASSVRGAQLELEAQPTRSGHGPGWTPQVGGRGVERPVRRRTAEALLGRGGANKQFHRGARRSRGVPGDRQPYGARTAALEVAPESTQRRGEVA